MSSSSRSSTAIPSIAADTTRQLFEQGRKWVEDEIEKWASAARAEGITVRTIVRTGSAQEEIVNLATDERAELIIIGTHGRTGLNRLLLGSIADRVIRFAPCPVLTVRTAAPNRLASARAPGRTHRAPGRGRRVPARPGLLARLGRGLQVRT